VEPALTESLNIVLRVLSGGRERCAQAGTLNVYAKDSTLMERIRDTTLCSQSRHVPAIFTRPDSLRRPEARPGPAQPSPAQLAELVRRRGVCAPGTTCYPLQEPGSVG
jgi:hypothetical protein